MGVIVHDQDHGEQVEVRDEHRLLAAEVIEQASELRQRLPGASFELGQALLRAREGRAYLADEYPAFRIWARDKLGLPGPEVDALLEVAPRASGNGFDEKLAALGLEKLRWLVRLPDIWERCRANGGVPKVVVSRDTETGEIVEKDAGSATLAEVANWVRDELSRQGTAPKVETELSTEHLSDEQVRRARERLGLIQEVVTGRETVNACAQRTKRSYNTIRRWVERYKEAGSWLGLVDSERPGRPSKLKEEDQRALIILCEAEPRIGTDEAVRRLRDPQRFIARMPRVAEALAGYPGWSSQCSLATVQAFRRRRRIPRNRMRSKDLVERFEAEYSGELLQIDIMDHLKLRELVPFTYKGKAYLVSGIDDRSRLVPYAEFCPGDETNRVLPVVFEMCRRMGGGWRKLLCDQGKQFVVDMDQWNRPRLNPAMERLAAECGIGKVIAAAPYRGQTKGKQEKWYQTMQHRGMLGFHMEELQEWNEWLWQFVDAYNNTPHAGLPLIENAPPLQGEILRGIVPEAGSKRHMTPREAWEAFMIPGGLQPIRQGADPERVCATEYERVGTGEMTVRVEGNHYSIPRQYVDEKLRVLVGVQRVWIYHDKTLVCEHLRLTPSAGERSILPFHETPRDIRLEARVPVEPHEDRLEDLEIRERLAGGGVRRRSKRTKKNSPVSVSEDFTPKIEKAKNDLGDCCDVALAWVDMAATERTKSGRMAAGTVYTYLDEIRLMWFECQSYAHRQALIDAIRWATKKRAANTKAIRTRWEQIKRDDAAAEANRQPASRFDMLEPNTSTETDDARKNYDELFA